MFDHTSFSREETRGQGEVSIDSHWVEEGISEYQTREEEMGQIEKEEEGWERW